MTITEEQRRLLEQDLARDVVRQRRQGGGQVSYVDGWYVITRLNAVFGYDGWSFLLGALTTLVLGDRTLVQVQGTLRAAGVERQDVGAAVSANATADALETAIKAAATDALKRCARTFGPSLGLALYDKEQRTVGCSTACQALLDSLQTATDLAAWARTHRAALEALPAEEQAQLRAAYATRRDEIERRPDPPPGGGGARPGGGGTTTAGTAGTGAPAARPDTVVALVHRLAEAASLDELVAVVVAGRGVPGQDPVWEAASARADALGAREVWHQRYASARQLGADPADWGVVAQVLRELATATDVAAVARSHAAAYGRLPRPLQDVVQAVSSARRAALLRGDVAGELLAAAGRATTEGAAREVYARLGVAARAGHVTQDQAAAITEALNERLALAETAA